MLAALPATLYAQTDSLTLKESVLSVRRNESLLLPSSDGTVSLRTDMLNTMPMLLGSSDPVRIAHYLPSMQTTGELDSGLHIQGNDHSHNLISAGGVPIYGASHLLGIFSVFNPGHYSSMSYSTRAGMQNRLGGMLDMQPRDSLCRRVTGSMSAGIMAAQGSLHLPTGRSSMLSASLRRSYMNLLYGSFLKIGGMNLRYGFTDANLSWLWQASGNDRIWLDAYWGNDAARPGAGSGMYGADIQWGNAMGAVHWLHRQDSGWSLRQTAYVSACSLDLNISYSDIRASAPSSILSCGYRAEWSKGEVKAGLDGAAHFVRPQQLEAENFIVGRQGGGVEQRGQEADAWLGWSRRFGRLGAAVTLKGLLWHGPDGTVIPDAGPEVMLEVDLYRAGKLTAWAGIQHQYLMQAGITDLGLPCEFWFLAGSVGGPQHSMGASLKYSIPFAAGACSLQAEVYYKHLRNQVEYKNGFLDLLYSTYSLENSLLVGSGRAYGLNLMLHKQAGPLTGWLSYAWGRSLRSFPGMEETPSSHEREHEFDFVASYRRGRWNFGVSFIAASGTPYTPPVALYVLSNRIMAEYGPHNSARLGWYRRLDVSASLFFVRSPEKESGLNFSLYNALGARNELFRQLSVDKDGFSFGPSSINIRFMPSVCYFLKF